MKLLMSVLKSVFKFMVKRKKLFAVYMVTVAAFGGALIYHFVKDSITSVLLCLATAVPFLGLSSLYAWLGKEHVEIAYRNETFSELVRYRLWLIWTAMGFACVGATLMFLWLYLQYKSGNVRV